MLDHKARRARRKAQLQAAWNKLSKTERARIEATASENQNSEVLQRLFQTSESHRHRECLKQLDREIPTDDADPAP